MKHYAEVWQEVLYLSITRRNILSSASLFTSFMHSPSHIHFCAEKRMLSYLKKMKELWNTFKKNVDTNLVGYCGSDFLLMTWKAPPAIVLFLKVQCLHGLQRNSNYSSIAGGSRICFDFFWHIMQFGWGDYLKIVEKKNSYFILWK